MRFSKSFFVIIPLIFGFTFLVACRKKKDTIAKVYVRNGVGDGVASATVILKGISTTAKASTFADTAITNSDGEAIFNLNDMYKLGQAGVAVLDIVASLNSTTTTGVIQVEQETTSEATVYY